MQKIIKRVLFAQMLNLVSDAGAAQAESVYVDSIQCMGGQFGLALPIDARELRSLGRVLRYAVEEREQWDGYIATHSTLYFKGMTLGIIEFSNDPSRFTLTFAELTSPTWNSISPFKLRGSVDKVRALFGDAAASDFRLENSYYSESDSIGFKTDNGLVTRITYTCYAG